MLNLFVKEPENTPDIILKKLIQLLTYPLQVNFFFFDVAFQNLAVMIEIKTYS